MVRPTAPIWLKLTALLFAVLWLPVSSHEWLEAAQLIHSDDHCPQDAVHEAADGFCRLENSDLSLKPILCALPLLSPALTESAILVSPPSEPPPRRNFCHGNAPPELSRRWQFSERAALPGRAPDFAA